MSGGFEWCGARYGIRRCLSGLALSRNDFRNDFGFKEFPCFRLIAGAVLTALSDIDAFGTQGTRPPLIHRVPHTSHSGFHVYCMS